MTKKNVRVEEIKAATKNKITHFLETFSLNIGKTLHFSEAICTFKDSFDRHFTTFSSTEFILKNFSVRISGTRIIFRGDKLDYEIGLDTIISIEENDAKIVFIEAYSKEI